MRVGFGYDSHRLEAGRRLVLGGVEIPHHMGLRGHSDADALAHAVMDAIIGALGEGDIGRHFPDTDPAYEGADSMGLLRRVVEMARERGYEVAWVDATVIAEAPRLAPHIEAMAANLRGAGIGGANVKAKSNEGMGFVGRGEGMAAYAVCVLAPR